MILYIVVSLLNRSIFHFSFTVLKLLLLQFSYDFDTLQTINFFTHSFLLLFTALSIQI